MDSPSEIRVRIAPSPTGDWHLGNARTALFNYLFARHTGGKFYLRVEDTDQARLAPGSVERLTELLHWLNMAPDPLPDGQPFLRQSDNLARYREVVLGLVEAGQAYYCFATSEELADMRQQQMAAKQPPRYDGRYRDYPLDKAQGRIAQGEPYVIRQKMPREGTTKAHDSIHDAVIFENSLLDDHILLKSDGFPTYHLAHVVDDHDMGITHVIRGDEWLPSLPRHLHLYESLGWSTPQFAHVPVILGPDKGKLSKRHGAEPVYHYEQQGYLPEALLNFLVLLGWSDGTDKEIFTPEEMIERFDLAKVHASPAVFSKERLDWFNGMSIRALSLAELTNRIKNYVRRFGSEEWVKRYEADPELFQAIVQVLHDRLVTLGEFPALAELFYRDPTDYDVTIVQAKGKSSDETRHVLNLAIETLSQTDDWSHDALEQTLRDLAQTNNLKAGDILWPIRAALTGLPASPGVFDLLSILGQAVSLRRLAYAMDRLPSNE